MPAGIINGFRRGGRVKPLKNRFRPGDNYQRGDVVWQERVML